MALEAEEARGTLSSSSPPIRAGETAMCADEGRSNGGPPASYYAVLGVGRGASSAEIRTSYRRMAMQWHPDRKRGSPLQADEAKRRFQEIQEAYQVLSDEKRRILYDAGLYDPIQDDDEEEGFYDFVQEMMSLMATVRREEKRYSLEELQLMLYEMAQDFNSPSQPLWSTDTGSLHTSDWSEGDPERESKRKTPLQFTSTELFGSAGVAVDRGYWS